MSGARCRDKCEHEIFRGLESALCLTGVCLADPGLDRFRSASTGGCRLELTSWQVPAEHDVHQPRSVFGNRSVNTVLRRGNCMVKYLKWYRSSRFSVCPFPFTETDVEEHLEYLTLKGVSPSGLSGFLQALRFCSFVVGISQAEPPNSISLKPSGWSKSRTEKKQARVLTVAEVEVLERILLDEKEEIMDRYAAGAFLFCLYSNGAIAGYLELRTRSHKTFRLVAHQGLAMSLVAPVWGLLSPP